MSDRDGGGWNPLYEVVFGRVGRHFGSDDNKIVGLQKWTYFKFYWHWRLVRPSGVIGKVKTNANRKIWKHTKNMKKTGNLSKIEKNSKSGIDRQTYRLLAGELSY